LTCREVLESEMGLTCEGSFCPSCAYAGVCNFHCGYCGEGEEEEEEEEEGHRTRTSEECGEGEILDCSGSCYLDVRDTTVSGMQWQGVLDWLGNGCCDEGQSWQSDVGFFPDFNCPMYGCDGGDCEVCGIDPTGVIGDRWEGGGGRGDRCRDMTIERNDGRPSSCKEVIREGILSCEAEFCDECSYAGYCDRTCALCEGGKEREGEECAAKDEGDTEGGGGEGSNFCIMLTAAICPAQNMTHTVRKQPRLREREYDKVLKRWAEHYDERRSNGEGPLPRIIFVENGNNNLDALRGAVGKGEAERQQSITLSPYIARNLSLVASLLVSPLILSSQIGLSSLSLGATRKSKGALWGEARDSQNTGALPTASRTAKLLGTGGAT